MNIQPNIAELESLRPRWSTLSNLTLTQVQTLDQKAISKASNSLSARNLGFAITEGFIKLAYLLVTSNENWSFSKCIKLSHNHTGVSENWIIKHMITVLNRPEAAQGADGAFVLKPEKTTIAKTNIATISSRGLHLIISSDMSNSGASDQEEAKWNELSSQYRALHQELFLAFHQAIQEVSRSAEELSSRKRKNDQLRVERAQTLSTLGSNSGGVAGPFGGFSAYMDKKLLGAITPGFASARKAFEAAYPQRKRLRTSLTGNLGLAGTTCNMLSNLHLRVIQRTVSNKVGRGDMTEEEGRLKFKASVTKKIADIQGAYRFFDDNTENARFMFDPVANIE